MPVDRKGNKLHTGDIVHIPCVVVGIDPHPEFINVMLQTLEPVPPTDRKRDILINSQLTELVESLGESSSDIDVTTAINERTKDE